MPLWYFVVPEKSRFSSIDRELKIGISGWIFKSERESASSSTRSSLLLLTIGDWDQGVQLSDR